MLEFRSVRIGSWDIPTGFRTCLRPGLQIEDSKLLEISQKKNIPKSQTSKRSRIFVILKNQPATLSHLSGFCFIPGQPNYNLKHYKFCWKHLWKNKKQSTSTAIWTFAVGTRETSPAPASSLPPIEHQSPRYCPASPPNMSNGSPTKNEWQ